MPATILSRIFSNRRIKNLTVDQDQEEIQQSFVTRTYSTPSAPESHNKEPTLQKHPLPEQRSSRSTMTEPRHSKPSTSIPRANSHVRRASYDSVREQSDVPQSFTKFSPEARSKPVPFDGITDVEVVARANGDWDFFVGKTKPIEFRGRRRSNSCTQLPRLASLSKRTPLAAAEEEKDVRSSCEQQTQPTSLGSLPVELLEPIMKLLVIDTSTNEYLSRYRDIASCLRVSRAFYEVATEVLYQNISISHSIIFSKFMARMTRDPELAAVVKRLDFSHYTNIGFGRTRQASSEILNVTPQTLLQCLELTTNLREFLVHEHLDDELSLAVIAKLFSMPTVQALDFCASSSQSFAKAFSDYTDAMALSSNPISQLKRLSLHECGTLQSPIFEALLPRLPNLTHLDVAHTLVTDAALWSISPTARLTHLNLGRCTRVTGRGVVRFLTTHPAVKDSLIFLNLNADAARYRLLSEDELAYLLPRLPATLRSLNVGGARINNSHLPLLRPITRRVEELGLNGADLSIDEVNGLFTTTAADAKSNSTVRYVDLSHVASVTQVNLHFTTDPLTSLKTQPLEVIELGESVLEQLKKRNKTNKNPEWVVRELGRRGWYVRQPSQNSQETDDGRRSWKMGARWWGMRKVPVAEQEVGGMYGFYAFKRV